MEYSSSPSLGRAALIAEHRNKQVGDARRAHVAKRGELLAFDTIEQQDAAPEHLARSEEHTSELQSRLHLVCRLLLEKKHRQPFAFPHGILRCGRTRQPRLVINDMGAIAQGPESRIVWNFQEFTDHDTAAFFFAWQRE